MKITVAAILVMIIMFTNSCKKNEEPSGGTWTFESSTYTATSSYADDGSFLTATTLTSKDSATYSTLQVEFNGTSLPTSSGTYTVVAPYPTAPNQVAIGLTTGGVAPGTKLYQSTGSSGTLTVQVTVSGRTITVSGSGIEMINTGNASDSSALTFKL